MAGILVELELEYGVGPVAGDVWNEGKAVGRVGLHGVGPGGRFKPLDRFLPNRSIIPNGMHRHVGALVIGRQDKLASSVRIYVNRPRLQWNAPVRSESAVGLVYLETEKLWSATASGVKELTVWTERQCERPAGHGNFSLRSHLPGLGVYGEN